VTPSHVTPNLHSTYQHYGRPFRGRGCGSTRKTLFLIKQIHLTKTRTSAHSGTRYYMHRVVQLVPSSRFVFCRDPPATFSNLEPSQSRECDVFPLGACDFLPRAVTIVAVESLAEQADGRVVFNSINRFVYYVTFTGKNGILPDNEQRRYFLRRPVLRRGLWEGPRGAPGLWVHSAVQRCEIPGEHLQSPEVKGSYRSCRVCCFFSTMIMKNCK